MNCRVEISHSTAQKLTVFAAYLSDEGVESNIAFQLDKMNKCFLV